MRNGLLLDAYGRAILLGMREHEPMADQQALDELVRLLTLEIIEVDIFRGIGPDERRQRVFGGQVAAQALMAAARTVRLGSVHSLHAYFLRGGDPNLPIIYEVDRIRDGRSFTTRRVVAIQHGKAIFNLSASFHIHEHGLNHAFEMPSAPEPSSLPDFATLMASHDNHISDWFFREQPIDLRYVSEFPLARRGPLPPVAKIWVRANGALPNDPTLHSCILTYMSDMTLLDSTLLPHGLTGFGDTDLMAASLDHAMWFHRPFRADEWLLYAQDTPTASGARGLARGLIYTHDGRLVASVVQEGLMRIAPDPK